MPYQKVTLIDDLPDIDSMDDSPSSVDVTRSIPSRFIKKDHSPHIQSGMRDTYVPSYADTEIIRPQVPIYKERIEPVQEKSVSYLSCQDIYYHIDECPMCKKFYNPDKTIYLIIIAILIIVCTLLLKKVLNV